MSKAAPQCRLQRVTGYEKSMSAYLNLHLGPELLKIAQGLLLP